MPGWLRKPLRKPECPGGLVDTPTPCHGPVPQARPSPPEPYSFPRPEAQTTWTGRQAVPGPWPCGDFQLPQLDRAGPESPDCLACAHKAILCWPCPRLSHVPPGETRGKGPSSANLFARPTCCSQDIQQKLGRPEGCRGSPCRGVQGCPKELPVQRMSDGQQSHQSSKCWHSRGWPWDPR